MRDQRLDRESLGEQAHRLAGIGRPGGVRRHQGRLPEEQVVHRHRPEHAGGGGRKHRERAARRDHPKAGVEGLDAPGTHDHDVRTRVPGRARHPVVQRLGRGVDRCVRDPAAGREALGDAIGRQQQTGPGEGPDRQQVQQSHHPEADDQHAVVRAHAGSAQRLHDARQRLDERRDVIGELVGHPHRVRGHGRRLHDRVRREPAWYEAPRPPRRAVDKVPARAEPADQARSVMVDEHAVPRPERHAVGDVDHLAHGLVAQRDGRFALHVPIHDLAGTQAARPDADKHLAPLERRERQLLEAEVAGGMIHGRGGRCRPHHTHAVPSGTIAYFAPAPRSRS